MPTATPAAHPRKDRPQKDRHRHGYSFREGLAMMAAQRAGIDPELAGEAGDEVRDLASLIARAATARDAETRTAALADARAELARFDSARHPELARVLRARMAELDPSFTADRSDVGPDVVVPAWVHTPDLLRRFVAGQVARGVDPARIRLPNAAERAAAEQDASINPATGMEEFGLWSSIKSLFGGRGNTPDPTAAVSPSPARPAAPPQIDPIPIAGRRNTERLGPPAGIERIAASGPAAPRFVPPTTALELEPTWRVDPPNPFYNQEVFDTFKALVANWEKPIDKKYPGPEGKITGGYGRVYPNDTIRNVGDPVSTEEAEHNLMEDYRTWADTAHRVITRELEPHQRAAMLSLMHNIGPAAFSNPNHKMLQALNRGDDVAMEKEFREWRKHYDPKTKAKVISPGLENRRDDEMNVYFGRPRRDHY